MFIGKMRETGAKKQDMTDLDLDLECLNLINPLTRMLTYVYQTTFENTVTKGEIARYQKFLIFFCHKIVTL